MNYLLFESFISIPVLIASYYIGALIIPALFWYKRSLVIKITEVLTRTFPLFTARMLFTFIILFLICEVVWRMMFEAMIGYFQMREYLQHLVG
jgi:hypothetical protein